MLAQVLRQTVRRPLHLHHRRPFTLALSSRILPGRSAPTLSTCVRSSDNVQLDLIRGTAFRLIAPRCPHAVVTSYFAGYRDSQRGYQLVRLVPPEARIRALPRNVRTVRHQCWFRIPVAGGSHASTMLTAPCQSMVLRSSDPRSCRNAESPFDLSAKEAARLRRMDAQPHGSLIEETVHNVDLVLQRFEHRRVLLSLAPRRPRSVILAMPQPMKAAANRFGNGDAAAPNAGRFEKRKAIYARHAGWTGEKSCVQFRGCCSEESVCWTCYSPPWAWILACFA